MTPYPHDGSPMAKREWLKLSEQDQQLGPGAGHWTDPKNLTALRNKLLSSGGFTYNAVSGKEPTEGYAMSRFPEREKVVPASELTEDHLRDYIRANHDLLGSASEHHFGGWHDKESGNVYLDVSHVIPGNTPMPDVQQLLKKHNQKAAWDLKEKKEITRNED